MVESRLDGSNLKERTVSKLLIAGVFMVFSVAASAGEMGVINQAGPYEATMRFYLHPAHGFPGKAETTEQGSSVAGANQRTRAQASSDPEKVMPTAPQAAKTEPDRPNQVATRERR